jgi:hypothetical protein
MACTFRELSVVLVDKTQVLCRTLHVCVSCVVVGRVVGRVCVVVLLWDVQSVCYTQFKSFFQAQCCGGQRFAGLAALYLCMPAF